MLWLWWIQDYFVGMFKYIKVSTGQLFGFDPRNENTPAEKWRATNSDYKYEMKMCKTAKWNYK